MGLRGGAEQRQQLAHAHSSVPRSPALPTMRFLRSLRDYARVFDPDGGAFCYGARRAGHHRRREPADVASNATKCPVGETRSSGFALNASVAALWHLANTSSYVKRAFAAVNSGDDKDITAAVACVLAGIVYGIGGVPFEWIKSLWGIAAIEASPL